MCSSRTRDRAKWSSGWRDRAFATPTSPSPLANTATGRRSRHPSRSGTRSPGGWKRSEPDLRSSGVCSCQRRCTHQPPTAGQPTRHVSRRRLPASEIRLLDQIDQIGRRSRWLPRRLPGRQRRDRNSRQMLSGRSRAARAVRRRAGAGEKGAGERTPRADVSRFRKHRRRVESAGRAGARLGKVSELTIIVPFAPGGAKRLRAFLQLLGGNLHAGADKVGTLHDMRFVFLDNDTKMLFATAYDGDWDAYIDDFVDEDSRLPGHHRLGVGRLAGHSQPGGEGLSRQAPDHGGRLVRRQSGSDGGGDRSG